MMRLSGRFRSALIIGGQGIHACETRTLLSIISLFLDVLAVVIVQAGAEAANRSALDNIELTMGMDGTRQMLFPAGAEWVRPVLDTLKGRDDAVAVIGGHAIIGEPGVTAINPGGSHSTRPGRPPGDHRASTWCVTSPAIATWNDRRPATSVRRARRSSSG